jgi:hypothetical protein
MNHPSPRPAALKFWPMACSLSMSISGAMAAAPNNPRVYLGELAGRAIVMRLFDDNRTALPLESAANVRAQYFYRSFGRYITLQERADGWLAECQATFRELDCSKPGGLWKFRTVTDMRVEALWKAADTAAPVQLTLASAKQSDLPAGSGDVWDRLLADGPRRTSRRSKVDGIHYAVLTDPRSGAKVPQILAGVPRAAADAFNNERRRELARRTAEALENQTYGGGESDDAAVQFASSRWLTWAGGSGGDYGGAHPLWVYSISTFDLSNGQRVDASALFKRAAPVVGNGSPRIVVNATGVPATLDALVVQHAWRSTPHGAQPTGSSERAENDCFEEWRSELADCEFDDHDRPTTCEILRVSEDPIKKGTYRVWNIEPMLTTAGLAIVSNDTSEAARACRGVMLTIPWREAQPLLKPNVKLR